MLMTEFLSRVRLVRNYSNADMAAERAHDFWLALIIEVVIGSSPVIIIPILENLLPGAAV